MIAKFTMMRILVNFRQGQFQTATRLPLLAFYQMRSNVTDAFWRISILTENCCGETCFINSKELFNAKSRAYM